MATPNQNYANLLTLRFYNSLIAPSPIKPSEIPGITTFSKEKARNSQPGDCLGYGIQTKVSNIDMRIRYTEDSFGNQNTPEAEYKRCLNAIVKTSIVENETSECLRSNDYSNAISMLGMSPTNGVSVSPYRAFSLVPSVEGNDLLLKGQCFIVNTSGNCDHCLLKNKVCSWSKSRNYNQTHKVCQNRIGYSNITPGPDFPEVSPEIQDYRFMGHRTSWIFREALLGIINVGGLQFESNCACEEVSPAIKPTTARTMTESEMDSLSGESIIQVGRNQETSFAPTDGIRSSTPRSSTPPPTSSSVRSNNSSY